MTELANPLGGERLLYRWRGHDVAYVRRGEGPPMLLVHSVHAAAWSMEWRNCVPALSERFTTYSVDLLGFGASGHPALQYDAQLYVDLLTDLAADVIGAPAVWVGCSLGATYAVAVAARRPDLALAVCAIGPAGVGRLDKVGGRVPDLASRLLRSGGVGTCLFAALTSRPSMRRFLRDIYSDPGMLSDDVLDLYVQAARQENARFAPAAFIGFRLSYDLRDDLVRLACPLLLVWGEQARQTPLREADGYRALRPDAPFEVLPGGDLPHEEHPADFVAALTRFVDEL